MKPLKQEDDKPLNGKEDMSETRIEMETKNVTTFLNKSEAELAQEKLEKPAPVNITDEEAGQLTIVEMETPKYSKEKISSLELLKILSLLLIISQYYSIYTYPKLNKNNYLKHYSKVWIFICLIRRFGNAGWNIIMLITGYVTVTTKGKRKNFFLLTLEIVFYYYTSLFITKKFLAPRYHKTVGGLKDKAVWFPILNYTNKYTDNYILMNCFVTFMNEFLVNMEKETYFNFMVMLFLFYCILPDLTRNIYHFFVGVLFQRTDLDVLIIMYTMGAYFRLHGIKNKTFWRYAWVVSFLLYVCGENFFQHLAIKKHIDDLLYYNEVWENYNTLPCVVLSIGLFITFATMNFKSAIINYIAESIFGIYLLYDNRWYKEYVWHVWYPFKSQFTLKGIAYHYITKMIYIFLICLGIDIARRCTIEYLLRRILKTQWKNIKKILGGIANCYLKIFECIL